MLTISRTIQTLNVQSVPSGSEMSSTTITAAATDISAYVRSGPADRCRSPSTAAAGKVGCLSKPSRICHPGSGGRGGKLRARRTQHQQALVADECGSCWYSSWKALAGWKMNDVPERPVTPGPHDDPSISDDELIRRRTEWFRYVRGGGVMQPHLPPTEAV
ncbi:hypothetical protein ACFY36_09920 [Actinoplanes sp. NPDC000266]